MVNEFAESNFSAWIILAGFFTISWIASWLVGRKFGAVRVYEEKAGKPIVIGKDIIPLRFKEEGVSFLIRNVGWRGWSNMHKRCIIDSELIHSGLGTASETIIFDKWVEKGEETLYREGNIFRFSETGELKFIR